jgi:hypothetical protein
MSFKQEGNLKKIILSLISVFIISNQASAYLILGISSPISLAVIGGSVVIGSALLSDSSNSDSYGDALQKQNLGLLYIAFGIILNNKSNKMILSSDALGFDASEINGFNLNTRLSANQLYQDLQWQRDARNADISDEKLAFYADHLNAKAISELLNRKLNEL